MNASTSPPRGSRKAWMLIGTIVVALIFFAICRTPVDPAPPSNDSTNVVAPFLKSGNDALNLGEFTAAKEDFEYASRFGPTNAHAAIGLYKARLLEPLQKLDCNDKLRTLERKIHSFLQIHPNDPHALLGLAQLRFANKTNLSQAMNYLNTAIAREDSLVPAYALKGDIYACQDSSEKAAQMYQKAWQLAPENLAYLSKLAEYSAKLLAKQEREICANERLEGCRESAPCRHKPLAREEKSNWRIQLTTCRIRESAHTFKKRFEAKYGSEPCLKDHKLRLLPVQQGGRYLYVVQLEGFDSKSAATRASNFLKNEGLEYRVLSSR